MDGVKDAPKVDPSKIFFILFGSEKMEDLFGKLRMALMMEYQEY